MTMTPPTVDELRQWADNPDSSSRMVPVHPTTLRVIADTLAARDAEVAQLREAKDAAIRLWNETGKDLQARDAEVEQSKGLLMYVNSCIAERMSAELVKFVKARIDAALAQTKEPATAQNLS